MVEMKLAKSKKRSCLERGNSVRSSIPYSFDFRSRLAFSKGLFAFSVSSRASTQLAKRSEPSETKLAERN